MKKSLVMVLAIVAAFSMFCSTAFAGQGTIAPATWDGFEINIRKADPANVVKDGIIGKDEYDEIEIDNEKMVFVNYTTPDDKDFDWDKFKSLAEDLKKSMKVFVSWDETNGFNIAVQYHVPAKDYKSQYEGEDESFLFTKLGGVLIQIRNAADCSPLNDPDGSYDKAGIWGGNVVYHNIGYNTDSNKIFSQMYQAGYDSVNGNKLDPATVPIAFVYDEATETVTVEASYPMNQVTRADDAGHIYFAPQACRGQSPKGGWGGSLAIACFGETGFYVKQETVTNQRCMTGNVVEEAVGYVEPEPTPVPTPVPTPEPKPEEPTNNVIPYVVMGVEGVAIIALIVALVLKKK